MEAQNFKKTTSKNTLNLAAWTFAWVITTAFSTFGPKFIWDVSNTTYSGMAIGLTFLVGVGMIFANRRFIEGLDELQKKIQLEAMAFALGFGMVGGLCFASMDQANVISKDADIGILVMFIGVVYMIGIGVGHLRFK
ncbi:MAG: hypothetical protein JXR10_10025 [Cyclobacteriaceae bacterium]